LTNETPEVPLIPKPGFYYGWVMLGLSVLAMVGTLPGRTQGLGLITEKLQQDLRLGDVEYANINLWATLIGALFCIGVGRLMDRIGARVVLSALALGLGLTVLAMSHVTTIPGLFALVTLTRGLGQSALSVVSLTMIGLWFRRRITLAMAVFTVVMSMGFMVAFPVVGAAVQSQGWRSAWAAIGWGLLLGLLPAALLLAKRSPNALDRAIEGEPAAEEGAEGYTLVEAVSTASFWVMGLSSAVYLLIASGIGLFNEAILRERGFPANVYHNMLAITAMTSLVGNFLGGWLATKWPMNRLMTVTMLLLMVGLLAIPFLTSTAQVAGVAVLFGVAGGFVMVLFFAFWRAAYGTAQLGQIQGAAQTLTVIASAIGPLLLAVCVERTGSYNSAFYALAVVVLALAAAAWAVKMPPAANELKSAKL
jgi:MFS family permease